LFIIQDDTKMSLVHYNREKPTGSPIIKWINDRGYPNTYTYLK
jgi:hypothetical protein